MRGEQLLSFAIIRHPRRELASALQRTLIRARSCCTARDLRMPAGACAMRCLEYLLQTLAPQPHTQYLPTVMRRPTP